MIAAVAYSCRTQKKKEENLETQKNSEVQAINQSADVNIVMNNDKQAIEISNIKIVLQKQSNSLSAREDEIKFEDSGRI